MKRMPRGPEIAAPSASAWQRATAGLCAALSLLTIWWPPRIPSQDAPLYHLAIHVLGAPERFAGFIDTGLPLSGAGVQVLAGHLLAWLEPTVALKLVLSAGLIVYLLAAARLARQLERPPAVAIALHAALYVGWVYAMGFFNFLVAGALASWACVVWLDEAAGRSQRVLLGVVLLLAAYVHAVGAAFVCLAVALAALIAHGPGWVLRRSGPLWAPALYTLWVLWVIREAERNTSGVEFQASMLAPSALLPRLPEMVYAAYSPLAPLLFFWAVFALGLAVWRTRSLPANATPAARLARGLVLSGAALLLVTLAVPLHVSDWYFAQPRLLPLCFGLPIIACLPRGRGALTVPALISLAVLSAGLDPARQEGERIQSAVEKLPTRQRPVGMAFVQVTGERSPHLSVPLQRPGLHVHAYGMLGGGASYFTFPGNARINPLRPSRNWRPPRGAQYERLDDQCAAEPSCFEPQRHVHMLAARALHYDTLLLPLTPDAVVEGLRALGWRWIAPNAFEVGRARVSVRVAGEAPGAPVILRAGFPATIGIVRAARLEPAALAGGQTVEFGPLPAGPLALEAFVDVDGSGHWSEADRGLLSEAGRAMPLSLEPGEDRLIELRDQRPPGASAPAR